MKGRKPRPWVRLGLPEARVFQAALPITSANQQHTPQNFFLEAVQATNVRAEDRIVELVKVELGGRGLACVAASPRNAIEASIGMMSRLGARWTDRAGPRRSSAPGRITGSRRMARSFAFVSSWVNTTAIGIIAVGCRPLFWHAFDLPSGEEIAAILAAYSTLWMMGRQRGSPCPSIPSSSTVGRKWLS